MPITLGYIGFSMNPGFPETDIVTRFFKDGDRVSNNLSEINVLFIGDFITMEELEMIQPYRGLRILYVAEPVLNLPMCSIAGQIFQQKKYNAVIGCISNRGDTHNWIKYPIYRYSVKFTQDSFAETNMRVASICKADLIAASSFDNSGCAGAEGVIARTSAAATTASAADLSRFTPLSCRRKDRDDDRVALAGMDQGESRDALTEGNGAGVKPRRPVVRALCDLQ